MANLVLDGWDKFLTNGQEATGEAVTSQLKTQEEIEKYTVDPDLNDLNRAKLYLAEEAPLLQVTATAFPPRGLSHSSPITSPSCNREVQGELFGAHLLCFAAVQKLHALQSVSELLKSSKSGVLLEVLPLVHSYLNRPSCAVFDLECQHTITASLESGVKEGLLDNGEVQAHLLPMIMGVVNNSRDDDVVKCWLALLRSLVPQLSIALVKEELVPLALARGEVQETVQSRMVCGSMLGILCKSLSLVDIEGLFLEKALALCQDTDYQVRICMCQQLCNLCEAVGQDVTQNLVLR